VALNNTGPKEFAELPGFVLSLARSGQGQAAKGAVDVVHPVFLSIAKERGAAAKDVARGYADALREMKGHVSSEAHGAIDGYIAGVEKALARKAPARPKRRRPAGRRGTKRR